MFFFSCHFKKAKTTNFQTLLFRFVFLICKLASIPYCNFFLSRGPSASLLVANLVEVRQIHPGGNGDETLVEEPEGTIIALDYDPIQKHVRRVLYLWF